MLVHSNADAMGWFREVNAIDKWMRWLLCALAHTHTHIHMKMKTSTHTHANANAHTLLCTSTAQTSASTIPLHGAAMEHSALASWNHRTHIVTTFSNYNVCVLHISFFATRWYNMWTGENERLNFSGEKAAGILWMRCVMHLLRSGAYHRFLFQ